MFTHLELGVFLPLLRALLREQRIKLLNLIPKVPESTPPLILHPLLHQEMPAGSAGWPQVSTMSQKI